MRAGTLDRRIAVQRKTLTYSDAGEPVEAWATIGAARWAMRFPTAGEERFQNEQLAAKEQVEFRLRWASDIANLQPQDRIIEPASDATVDPIPPRSTYDVIAAHEIGRREGWRVLTTRRVDVVP